MADIEARQLRLISPYGFIEDPSRLLRAVRLRSRLGWNLEERTQTRYENAKNDDAIDAISSYLKGYELEEIGHEQDGLRALKALEAEGWIKKVFPAWTSSKADQHGLEHLLENYYQLLMQGVHPDLSAAQMELLTAKMQTKDIAVLKRCFPRHCFVEQWNHLEAETKKFAALLTAKETATPSATWKLITSYQPEPVLWLAHTGKGAAIQNKFKNFFTVWPEFRQKIPLAIMQEMRITPEIERYSKLLENLFFHLIDGKLQTEEELRAFLEPYSPPAPPPPVTIRRSRKKAAEPKIKSEKFSEEEVEEVEVPNLEDLDLEIDEDEGEEEHEEAEESSDAKELETRSKPLPSTQKTQKKAAVKEKSAPPKKTAAQPAPAPARKATAKPAPPAKTVVKTKSAKKGSSSSHQKDVKAKPVKKAPAKLAKKAAKKKR